MCVGEGGFGGLVSQSMDWDGWLLTLRMLMLIYHRHHHKINQPKSPKNQLKRTGLGADAEDPLRDDEAGPHEELRGGERPVALPILAQHVERLLVVDVVCFEVGGGGGDRSMMRL